MKKIIMLFCILLLSGCGNTDDKITDSSTEEKLSYTIQSENFVKTIKLTGNIEAKKEIPISAKIIGRIDSLQVDIGDMVTQGDVLARYSAIDNDSYIQYQNALSQFKSTKASSENATRSANVQVTTQKRALAQVKKEEVMQQKKQYNNLYTNSKLSEITLSSTINFLDKNIEGSNRFRGMSPYQSIIGRTDVISKNNLKIRVANLVRNFEKLSKTIPNTEKEILKFSIIRLDFLINLKKDVLYFDNLVRKTVISASFSEIIKNQLIQETTHKLQSLSSSISNLENLIAVTNVSNEQSELKIISAQNALETSKSNLELTKSNSENQVVAARSQVSITSNSQQEMIVKAPFSGVITNRQIDMGQLVTPGQVMFQIADISGFKIKTNIADIFVESVEKQMPVKISVDGLSQSFTGKITKINPSLDLNTRKLGIEITFDNNDEQSLDKLKIGLFARISMKSNSKKTFFIPRNFIQFNFDGPTITTNDEKIIPIEILSEIGNKIEINFDGIADQLQIIQP